MNGRIITEVAEQACREESLDWPLLRVSPNRKKPAECEIYYSATGRKSHKILIRLSPTADSTTDSLTAEIRGYLRQLKESGML